MKKRLSALLLCLIMVISFCGCDTLVDLAEDIITAEETKPTQPSPSPEAEETFENSEAPEEVIVEETAIYPVFAVQGSYEEELLVSRPEFDLYLKGFESDETGYRIILSMKNHESDKIYFKYNAQSVNASVSITLNTKTILLPTARVILLLMLM